MLDRHPFDVAVIGAGPAGLMAAEILSAAGIRVTVYDRMPSAGRKLLMAGRGGLNLTHSEDFERFLERYGEATAALRPSIESFTPQDLRTWSQGLGQDTFIGSSGRVFPKAFKASPLLRAWLTRLEASGVRFAFRHRWLGWEDDGRLIFADVSGERHLVEPDATLLALGGASWPRLGSDGAWTEILAARGIAVAPLRPANMGFSVAWSETFASRFAGQPLKSVALSLDEAHVRGEAMITRTGIEGGAIYALSAALRERIDRDGRAVLRLDLKPDLTLDALATKLAAPRKAQSLSTFLRKSAGLAPAAIGLLREGDEAMPTDPGGLAGRIKALPVVLTGAQPIARAISSAGGIPFAEIDDRLMLRRVPGLFAAGEMLDWEAPTGGYLLQATLATGIAAARGVLSYLDESRERLTESKRSAKPQP